MSARSPVTAQRTSVCNHSYGRRTRILHDLADGTRRIWCADVAVAVFAEGGDVGVAGVGHAEAADLAQRRGLQGGKARKGQQPGAGSEAVMAESVPNRRVPRQFVFVRNSQVEVNSGRGQCMVEEQHRSAQSGPGLPLAQSELLVINVPSL